MLLQRDRFYHCSRGRLKLRTFSDGTGELIQYRRPDTAGAKESVYAIFPTEEPDVLDAVRAPSL